MLSSAPTCCCVQLRPPSSVRHTCPPSPATQPRLSLRKKTAFKSCPPAPSRVAAQPCCARTCVARHTNADSKIIVVRANCCHPVCSSVITRSSPLATLLVQGGALLFVHELAFVRQGDARKSLTAKNAKRAAKGRRENLCGPLRPSSRSLRLKLSSHFVAAFTR